MKTKAVYWNLLYLSQVGQTQGKGQVWMSRLQCVVQPDTALGFSPALSQTAFQQEEKIKSVSMFTYTITYSPQIMLISSFVSGLLQ